MSVLRCLSPLGRPRFSSASLLGSLSVFRTSPVSPLYQTTRTMASTKSLPSFKLNDGRSIPGLAFGVGTALYKGPGNDTYNQQIVDSSLQAIKLGYTHLDGAEVYNNEKELGDAIKASGVPRDSLFITTKWDPKGDPKATVEADFAASLQKLGVDSVDLYLIHSPYFNGATDEVLQARWAEVEAIQASGRARSIGVSNFLPKHLEAVLKTAKVTPAVNQIEYHPYLQHAADFVAFHKKHGIVIAAYGGLTPQLRAPGGPVDPVYAELAKKYSVTDSDIGLRWLLDSGIVAVTTSNKAARLQGYLDRLPSFALTADEVQRISAAGREKHYRAFWTHVYDKDDRN